MNLATLLHKKLNNWAELVQNCDKKLANVHCGEGGCFTLECESIESFLQKDISEVVRCKMPDYFKPITEYDIKKYALYCIKINDPKLPRPVLSTFIGIIE